MLDSKVMDPVFHIGTVHAFEEDLPNFEVHLPVGKHTQLQYILECYKACAVYFFKAKEEVDKLKQGGKPND